jgi:hypothetical protein
MIDARYFQLPIALGLPDTSHRSLDVSVEYEDWAKQYGPIFRIPVQFGREKIVLLDTKALVHFYSCERTTYVKPEVDRLFIDKIVRMFFHY